MKVKELIEYLKTLDQEKGIWVFYDSGYTIFPPVPDSTMEDDQLYLQYCREKAPELSVNDYIITAG